MNGIVFSFNIVFSVNDELPNPWDTPPPIDLIHIIEDSLRLLTDLLQERDVAVMVAQPFPIVRVDRSILLQVITNLVGNALKRVPLDRQPVVKIYSEARTTWVCLWIEDNGSEIALEYQDRSSGDQYSERSYQYEDETDSGIGVGGLTIVRQTLQQIGGQVGVEPLAAGNRLWIALPSGAVPLPGIPSDHQR